MILEVKEDLISCKVKSSLQIICLEKFQEKLQKDLKACDFLVFLQKHLVFGKYSDNVTWIIVGPEENLVLNFILGYY